MKFLKLILSMFGDLFRVYLPVSQNDEIAFAFLVHPRDVSDFYRKFPFLQIFPPKIVEFLMQFLWPITLSEITGLVSLKNKKPVKGWLISILFTSKMLLKKRENAQRKIVKALKLAERRGAKIVGLGALTSSITNGGADLVGKANIAITTGNSLTVAMVLDDIKSFLVNFDKQKISIAIIGATGSIGQAISIYLCKENIRQLVVIGKTTAHLNDLENKIKREQPKTEVLISNKINDIINSEIIIVATASPKVIIESNLFKKGAIIYDVSQPQNVSRNILEERPDLKIFDGGIVSTPNINYNFNFGLPKETAFACLTETMLLAAEGIIENYSIGPVTTGKIEKINNITKKYNFAPHKRIFT